MIDTEAVQAAMAAFGSGDREQLVEHVHPEFEGVVPASMSAEPGSYRGHEGVRRYFETFEEQIEDLSFSSEVIEEGPDEWVLARIHAAGQGRSSGVPVELDAIAAIQMRDGKLLKIVAYPSLDEARAAL